MKAHTVLRRLLWAVLCVWPVHACLDLKGVVSGGGDGLLDLDVLRVTLNASETRPFYTVVFAGLFGECTGGGPALETPISMRQTLGTDTSIFCVSEMFHPNPNALDIFGDKQKSDERRRCQPDDAATVEDVQDFSLHLRIAEAYAFTYSARYSSPSCTESREATMEGLGLPMSLIDEGDPGVETPWGLAKAYVDEIFAYLLENDGWNADGSRSREYNRIPFSDYAYTDSRGNSWQPYTPKNSPWQFKRKNRWQPLQEDDGFGFTHTQMHVVPHIGALGRFYGFNSTDDEARFASRQLRRPRYDYESSSLDVLEETRLAATDDFKQAAVQFYDDKLLSLVVFKTLYIYREFDKYDPMALYRVQSSVQIALYNAVVLAWKEKVRHDLPRPTSVIRDIFGDSLVKTYAGPGEGVQTIKASEWEPLIRTMPHSEFPSSSACMCKLFAETMINFTGNDTIDPPLIYPIGDDVIGQYGSWSQISDDCGNSRLWGGMHFYDAVPAGADLCGGGLVALSIDASLQRLIAGDETAAVFKYDPGELKVR